MVSLSIRPLLIICFVACIFVLSCKKELVQVADQPSSQKTITIPTVFTIPSKQTADSIITGGIVFNNGGDSIISKGVCWSKNRCPRVNTVKDSVIRDRSNQKQFTSFIAPLVAEETYYACAFATNAKGLTGYGQDIPIILTSPASPSPTEPMAGVVLFAKQINPILGVGQVFEAGKDTAVKYDNIAYKLDTTNKIISSAPPYINIFAPFSGLYALTSYMNLIGQNDNPDGAMKYYITANGKTIVSKTMSYYGMITLATTVHLNQGDTIQTRVFNGSSGHVATIPYINFVRIEVELLKADY